MKAVRFDEYGGVDVLKVVDVPRPVPGTAQILVQVKGRTGPDTLEATGLPQVRGTPTPWGTSGMRWARSAAPARN